MLKKEEDNAKKCVENIREGIEVENYTLSFKQRKEIKLPSFKEG